MRLHMVWMRWQVIIIVMFGFRGAGFIKFPGAPNPIQPPHYNYYSQLHYTGSHYWKSQHKEEKEQKKVTMLRFLPSSYNLKSQLDKDWRRPWWEVEDELIVPPRTHPGPWWGSTGRISLETWGSSGKCWPFSSPHQVRNPSLSTFSIGQGGGVF